MASTKRIGYVDYNLENFHANVYLNALRNELKDRGFAIAGCHGLLQDEGKQWSAKNDVPYFETPAEMNEHVDYLMVLAPSNPEKHLELCEMVFPFGKPTYVDKTFAPDLATAEKIFALADQHGVVAQTTSALRYTAVQKAAEELGKDDLRHMVAWGGGRSFEEYAIHPVEMTVSCMGPEATSLMRRGTGDQSQLLINFSDGRTSVVNLYANGETPYMATLTTSKKTVYVPVDGATLFLDTASAILDLFESGQPNIDRAQSLTIRRILDAAANPKALEGFVAL